MQIGLVKEIKVNENRVALTPEGVAELVGRGHQVYVEQSAGLGAGFTDDTYRLAGANLVATAEAWDKSLLLKVKEPVASEFHFLKQQIIFTYFHLAGVPRSLTDALLSAKTTAIAYETLEDEKGFLPLLAPMSAVAGNMATQMGGHFLAAYRGGKGVLLGSIMGRRHGEVLIIGDGVVGRHAAKTAIGLGAKVTIAGLNPENASRLQQDISCDLQFMPSSPETIAERVLMADLVVGAVLQHGARSPHVVTEAMVKSMQPGSVIVDVSIDQGGCVETSRPTTHNEPVFIKHDVLHYCVSNMPGAYPRTATLALTDATLPFVLQLADHGLEALTRHAGLAKAVNTHQGYISCLPVAEAFGLQDRYRAFPTDFI